MSVRRLTLAGVAAASWVALGVSAPALAVCDAYSGGCPTPLPSSVGGGGIDIGGGTENPGTGNSGTGSSGAPASNSSTGGTTANPATLPFTGGELVLMTAIGAGALAGGAALVVAGRRRGQSPA